MNHKDIDKSKNKKFSNKGSLELTVEQTTSRKGLINFIYQIRKAIYGIVDNPKNRISKIYNILIVVVAFFSVFPFFIAPGSTVPNIMQWILDYNKIWVSIFIFDYILRWIVSDFSIKRGWKSFFIFPFTLWAIIDLIGIAPYLMSFHQLQILATFRLFRVIRIFPRLQEGFKSILISIKNKSRIFLVILITLFFFIFIGSLIIFNVEYGSPNSMINSYWDAVWFVFITITTIGYGDIYPTTELGRIITILASMFGIALISIITAIFASGFSEMDTEIELSKQLVVFDENTYVQWDDTIDQNLKDNKVRSLILKEEKEVLEINEEEYLTIFEFDSNTQEMKETRKILKR